MMAVLVRLVSSKSDTTGICLLRVIEIRNPSMSLTPSSTHVV